MAATSGTTTCAAPVDIPLSAVDFDPATGSGSMSVIIGTPSGDALNVLVDTGSTGIVIPASYLTTSTGTPLPGVTCLGPAQITYYPKGDTQYGYYYLVKSMSLGLLSGSGSTATYACEIGPVVVFGIQCSSEPAQSTGSDSTASSGTGSGTGVPMVPVSAGFGMFGVGFGRSTDGYVNGYSASPTQTGGTTDTVYTLSNPFLHASSNSVSLYPSYILSSKGSATSQGTVTAVNYNGKLGVYTGYITLGVTCETFSSSSYGGTLAKLTEANPQPGVLNATTPTPASGSKCSCSQTPVPTPGNWPPPPAAITFWETATGSITLADKSATPPSTTYTTGVLLDTGINTMIINDSTGATMASNLASYEVTVAIPGSTSAAIMSYTFTINAQTSSTTTSAGTSSQYSVVALGTSNGGPTSPAQPASVGVIQASTTISTATGSSGTGSTGTSTDTPQLFVNTGINVLNCYNYFFDASAGYIGFAPVPT
ncbi:hypothetical protein [Azospirillum canadense]|uniref:hypothetical protein n=1 Tax=Azospirillum canadense TaxID=403962 RepID=UPI00222609AF|nr:hypothetical protein [Azospirillum canadense]MCW2236040.1 hypothetical protein [Azospirillum canadense]